MKWLDRLSPILKQNHIAIMASKLRGSHLNANPASMRRFVIHILVFVSYSTLFQFSEAFRTAEIHASPWHPEVGIAAIAGLTLGPAAIPTIALAHLVSSLAWNDSLYWILSFGTALITAFVYAGGAHLLRNWPWINRENPLKGIQNFLCYAISTAAALAVLRLVLFTQVYQISLSYYFPYALTNTVGNLIGVLTVTPLFLSIHSTSELASFFRSLSLTSVLALLTTIAASFVVFALPWTDEFRFFYLLFPPVVVLAVKDGLPGAAIGILLSDLMMIGILFFLNYEPWTLTELQIFMITLSICGIVLGAAIAERQRYSSKLLESASALQQSQTSLLQASRLTLADAVAAALAHEVNQPLTSARNYIRAVSIELEDPLKERKALSSQITRAVAEIDRAAAMIKSTRQFLSRGETPFSVLSANALLTSCLNLAKPTLKESGVEIVTILWPHDISIQGHLLQLQQVILGLIRNSQEAMSPNQPGRKQVHLSITPLVRPGFVEISISDTGPGIPPHIRRNLFIPLHSHKSEGLGIGLSLAKAIISAHGGEIWLDENFPHGARFSFTIPIAYDEVTAKA